MSGDGNGNGTGSGPPPKPWEQAPSSSGPAPFKPPSPGSTSDVVEASGTAKPGEIVNSSTMNPPTSNAVLARPVPARPWEQSYGGGYGGYGSGIGSGMNYNSSYGAVGSYGGSYGGGMYGNSMQRGSMYGGGLYGGSGMYGGSSMYGGGYGSPMGASYGMGMGMGGPYGEQDPNNPYGPPSSPPGFWMSFMRVMQGVVTFFGRVAMLIDQNTQAFHMFMSALLQLFDRSGMLYGELARFVFRLLGVKTKARKVHEGGPEGHHQNAPGGQNQIAGPKAAPSGSWDNVWGNNANGF